MKKDSVRNKKIEKQVYPCRKISQEKSKTDIHFYGTEFAVYKKSKSLDIFVQVTILWLVLLFFLVSTLVFQHGDTLLFTEHDQILETLILGEEVIEDSVIHERITRKAKVSPDHQMYLVHELVVDANYEYLRSEIVFYGAGREELWRETYSGEKRVMYEISDIYDSLWVLAVADKYNKEPAVRVIRGKSEEVIVEPGNWQRIVSVEISPNNRFMALHARKRYARKLWDYIYFIDLQTKQDWEYMFPTCLSCKRTNITLSVDDSGQVEAVHKAEHRIFSSEGKLIDIFLQVD